MVMLDVERQIAQACKAFGALWKSILLDCNLKVTTKRKVFQACVLSVLFYGSECWTPLKKGLDSFHSRCVRTILGIINKQQWNQWITSLEIRQRWDDPETATVKVMIEAPSRVAGPRSQDARSQHSVDLPLQLAATTLPTRWP